MAGLRIAKGRMIDVQQKIAADPRVFSVYDVTGDWDSIVLARVKNRADLDDLTKTVFTLEGVTKVVYSRCAKYRQGRWITATCALKQ